ncbi:MAG: IS3 family transposase [Ignavibacteriae bacterium]|nr:IS3 family transposase [Ignavibacteriota bacterium]MBX3045026.1 IS3 family transposase [Ignavibacteriota bacterium]
MGLTKAVNPKASIESICKIASLSRQAYYKHNSKIELDTVNNHKVLSMALSKRIRNSKLSCKKIYSMIKESLKTENIKLGRDKFINLMGENGFHVKRKRRNPNTTKSKHTLPTYTNKLKGIKINRADQVWVSDITFVRTSQGFMYLSLVTDLYSRKILGYNLSKSQKTSEVIKALQMSLKNSKRQSETIHHSDRGIQYLCSEYTKHLKSNNIETSTTKGGSPQENAVAERINGILKQEYGISDLRINIPQCRKLVKEAIELYNNERPHLSLNMKTPEQYYNEFYCNLNNNIR